MSAETPLWQGDGPIKSFYGYAAEECVFEYIVPEIFIELAFREVGPDPTIEGNADIQKVVYYSAQLAIATHRSRFVRDIEEAAEKTRVQRRKEERERNLREKYGGAVNETVSFANYTWPVDLFDSFADFMEQQARIPVIDDTTWEGELPEEYRRPDGTLVWNKPELAEALFKELDDPDPYHPHKGYHLSIEHDNLALALAGITDWIEGWDQDQPKNTQTYEQRYETFFNPDFFVQIALNDLKIDPTNIGERALAISRRAVTAIIEEYGQGTRERHEQEVQKVLVEAVEYGESQLIMDQLTPRALHEEATRDIDFERVKPEDFLE